MFEIIKQSEIDNAIQEACSCEHLTDQFTNNKTTSIRVLSVAENSRIEYPYRMFDDVRDLVKCEKLEFTIELYGENTKEKGQFEIHRAIMRALENVEVD